MQRFLILISCILYFLIGETQVVFPSIKTAEEVMNNYQAIIHTDFQYLDQVYLFSHEVQPHYINGTLQYSFFPFVKNPFTYSVGASNLIFLPEYTQGPFCDFEDHINRKRTLRIDFSVK